MKETELQYKTVTPLLKKVLQQLMNEPLFTPFRLVGGTNLSLRYGHRLSVDIDLFTDSDYGSLDFATYAHIFHIMIAMIKVLLWVWGAAITLETPKMIISK